ncbi:hypothetical protein EVAR_18336_1 [Eumeta japonica]|uniref:Uncharacterized protein n=1 Tax=Eumeta variegata TaxID=151549 RepID=A0A4C1V8L3_EUMVA|nr:hypothetical protein EVAR_18336_1 [Eumeta japonica]
MAIDLFRRPVTSKAARAAPFTLNRNGNSPVPLCKKLDQSTKTTSPLGFRPSLFRQGTLKKKNKPHIGSDQSDRAHVELAPAAPLLFVSSIIPPHLSPSRDGWLTTPEGRYAQNPPGGRAGVLLTPMPRRSLLRSSFPIYPEAWILNPFCWPNEVLGAVNDRGHRCDGRPTSTMSGGVLSGARSVRFNLT